MRPPYQPEMLSDADAALMARMVLGIPPVLALVGAMWFMRGGEVQIRFSFVLVALLHIAAVELWARSRFRRSLTSGAGVTSIVWIMYMLG